MILLMEITFSRFLFGSDGLSNSTNSLKEWQVKEPFAAYLLNKRFDFECDLSYPKSISKYKVSLLVDIGSI